LPFSWLVLGRSSGLRIHYRTSRQIRETADHFVPRNVRDVDGVEDDRARALSVLDDRCLRNNL